MMAKRKKAEPQPEQRQETPAIEKKQDNHNPDTACHGPTSVERRQSDNWWKET